MADYWVRSSRSHPLLANAHVARNDSTSRGIGLELTKQLLAIPTNTVVATCRNPDSATDLQALKATAQGTLHVVRLDVADEASIHASVPIVTTLLGEGAAIDYIYNNAAVVGGQHSRVVIDWLISPPQNQGNDTAFAFDPTILLSTIQSNVIGPAVVAQAYLPLLERSTKKTIVNVTSGLASIGLDIGDKCATYSMSKTMLNMLVSTSFSIFIPLGSCLLISFQTYKQKAERPDITTVLVDPGWVKTSER